MCEKIGQMESAIKEMQASEKKVHYRFFLRAQCKLCINAINLLKN
jgi:hypothetical protein